MALQIAAWLLPYYRKLKLHEITEVLEINAT